MTPSEATEALRNQQRVHLIEYLTNEVSSGNMHVYAYQDVAWCFQLDPLLILDIQTSFAARGMKVTYHPRYWPESYPSLLFEAQ